MAFRIRDAMKDTVVTVSAKAGVDEVCRRMFRHNATCVPVVDDNDRYVGLLTEADVLSWLFDCSCGDGVAGDAASRAAPVVGPDDRLIELVDVFNRDGVQHAAVVEEGHVVGVVANRELIRYTRRVRSRVTQELRTAASGKRTRRKTKRSDAANPREKRVTSVSGEAKAKRRRVVPSPHIEASRVASERLASEPAPAPLKHHARVPFHAADGS